MEFIEYKKGNPNPFNIYPQINDIWSKELQEEAKTSIDRYNKNESTGKILLISIDNYIVGITGYYFTDINSCIGLRWHGIIPSYRGKGLSTKVLNLLYDYIKDIDSSIQKIQEFAPFNEPHTINYFKSMDFIQIENEAKIYNEMPSIKCYRLVKTLKD